MEMAALISSEKTPTTSTAGAVCLANFSFAGIRFGLDAIIGLVPILGDSIALLIGLYPIYIAQQHHLGFFLRARMLLNLILDWIIGLIPIIGDAADVGFKANIRNAKLLRRAF